MSHIKFKKKKLSMLVLAAIAASLAACGGGGGGSGPLAAANTLTGVAVDGYLQGAIVFLDINRNGLADAGEPSTTTDLNGRYALDYSSVTGSVSGLPIVVTGGVDSDTGFAFAGKLSAPVESVSQAQVVTPMTTLVDAMVAHVADHFLGTGHGDRRLGGAHRPPWRWSPWTLPQLVQTGPTASMKF